MKVKFLRPVQGMAYFEGDVGEIPCSTKATALINSGMVILVPETEGNRNNLPEDIPAREILFENGLENITDVQNALPTITDLKGIGRKTAKDIKEFLSSNE